MTNESSPRLRVRSMPELLNLIPALLGFHPAESLVVVCVDGGRVAVTGRVDLAELEGPASAACCFDPLWERFPGSSCVAVAFSSDADAAWLALGWLVAGLPSEMPFDLAHVDGRCWHGSPDDPGWPYDPESSVQAAEAAYRGIRVLPDRAALAGSLSPGLTAYEMTEALEAVIARPPEETVAEALRLAAEIMGRPRVPTPEESAILAVAAYSPAFAESLVTGISSETAGRARDLWTCVVRSTQDFSGAAATLVLGMAAWVSGDGALLNVCLERAAPWASESQWYRFLEIAVRVALPPSEWDAVRLDLLKACNAA